jgi:hypothetical protein
MVLRIAKSAQFLISSRAGYTGGPSTPTEWVVHSAGPSQVEQAEKPCESTS